MRSWGWTALKGGIFRMPFPGAVDLGRPRIGPQITPNASRTSPNLAPKRPRLDRKSTPGQPQVDPESSSNPPRTDPTPTPTRNQIVREPRAPARAPHAARGRRSRVHNLFTQVVRSRLLARNRDLGSKGFFFQFSRLRRTQVDRILSEPIEPFGPGSPHLVRDRQFTRKGIGDNFSSKFEHCGAELGRICSRPSAPDLPSFLGYHPIDICRSPAILHREVCPRHCLCRCCRGLCCSCRCEASSCGPPS